MSAKSFSAKIGAEIRRENLFEKFGRKIWRENQIFVYLTLAPRMVIFYHQKNFLLEFQLNFWSTYKYSILKLSSRDKKQPFGLYL